MPYALFRAAQTKSEAFGLSLGVPSGFYLKIHPKTENQAKTLSTAVVFQESLEARPIGWRWPTKTLIAVLRHVNDCNRRLSKYDFNVNKPFQIIIYFIEL